MVMLVTHTLADPPPPQGSAEAMCSKEGVLSKEAYLELGAKRASAFRCVHLLHNKQGLMQRHMPCCCLHKGLVAVAPA